MVGVGNPLTFGLPPRWHDLGDGWKVGQTVPRFDPSALIRDQSWFDVQTVADLRGRTWVCPVVLTTEGTRAFRVAYGPDFLPALTPEQQRAESIAEAARAEMLSGSSSLDMAVACQWAAELLSTTNHVSPRVLACLVLLDDALVVGVLAAATSLPLKVQA